MPTSTPPKIRGSFVAYGEEERSGQVTYGDDLVPDEFIDLKDTPDSYVGQAGRLAAVNPGETALEFVVAPSPGAESFVELNDTPDSYVGQAGRFAAVNPGETALEFIAGGGGGGMTETFVDVVADILAPQVLVSDRTWYLIGGAGAVSYIALPQASTLALGQRIVIVDTTGEYGRGVSSINGAGSWQDWYVLLDAGNSGCNGILSSEWPWPLPWLQNPYEQLELMAVPAENMYVVTRRMQGNQFGGDGIAAALPGVLHTGITPTPSPLSFGSLPQVENIRDIYLDSSGYVSPAQGSSDGRYQLRLDVSATLFAGGALENMVFSLFREKRDNDLDPGAGYVQMIGNGYTSQVLLNSTAYLPISLQWPPFYMRRGWRARIGISSTNAGPFSVYIARGAVSMTKIS